LNSYSRQHSLYTALKSFGRIIKSMFILRYIDDVELRMAIENLLNRIELGNRFTRAIAVGNPREFSDGDKEEQEIAETCNRLIKNAIVCWNYLLLEHRLNQASTDELRGEIRAAVANHSVISWGHINLLGEYDFSDRKAKWGDENPHKWRNSALFRSSPCRFTYLCVKEPGFWVQLAPATRRDGRGAGYPASPNWSLQSPVFPGNLPT
jgi:hypothetical protein